MKSFVEIWRNREPSDLFYNPVIYLPSLRERLRGRSEAGMFFIFPFPLEK
jgi:hypothetical protein